MQYFDNIPFLNLDYFFNAIFKVVFFVPELILNAILFWSNVSASPALKVLFGIVTIAASGIIFFTLYKLWLLSQSEQVAFAALFAVDDQEKAEKRMINEEWADILSHIESPNQSNWVLAVIECDKILDGLLRERGFEGKDLGEMLKSEKGKNLRNLQDAWEGHKIRNRIAHEPGYVLTEREAKVAAAHYEALFKELGFLE